MKKRTSANRFKKKYNPDPESLHFIEHVQVLDEILERTQEIDFHEFLFPPGTTVPESKQIISQKHYQLLTIQDLLNTVNSTPYDVRVNNYEAYTYNGASWGKITEQELQRFLIRLCRDAGVPFTVYGHYRFQEGMMKQFRLIMGKDKQDADVDKVLINLANGTLEVELGEPWLRGFKKDDFLTYQLGFKYTPGAKYPQWQKYLNKVLPGKEGKKLQKQLAEFLGTIFMRNGSTYAKEEKILMLYGKGSSGKSVVYEVLRLLIGQDNISFAPISKLTTDNHYTRAATVNKLVNYSTEVGKGIDPAALKQMASGEAIEIHTPYEKPYYTTNYPKLIINANLFMSNAEGTTAYFRRFLIIPFDVVIAEKKQVKTLHLDIAEDELPGVLNWILDGLKRYYDNEGFTESEKSRAVLEEFEKTSHNSVLLFMQEYDIKPAPKTITSEQKKKLGYENVSIRDIFNDYVTYCLMSKLDVVGINKFSAELKNGGIKSKRVNQITGIEILSFSRA